MSDLCLVVLVGRRKAVRIAVRGAQGQRRCLKLTELLVMDAAAFATRHRGSKSAGPVLCPANLGPQ